MFNIGDKVVYPMHGAGVIESIEEKEILGDRKKYYVMKLPIGEMKVMIPMDSILRVGLREVIDKEMIDQVLTVLQDHSEEMSANWNRRYRDHLDKIKSGNILDVAGVVRNLTIRDRGKGLSTGERKMLDSAKQILISELILVQGVEQSEILDTLENIFNDYPE
ncbi:MAG: CarD family transcriptional regulator [Bacillota bacterium]